MYVVATDTGVLGQAQTVCMDKLTKTCSSLNGGMIATNRGTGTVCDQGICCIKPRKVSFFVKALDPLVGLKYSMW